ncbi:hypothetical protein [Bosea beijingensis]
MTHLITKFDIEAHLKRLVDDGYEIDAPIFEKLGTWNHILTQIVMCSFYLTKLAEHPEDGEIDRLFEWNAFFVAFLANYGKCFNSSHGKLVSMDPNRVFRDFPASRKIHDEIMRLRNTYAGHAGDSGIMISTMLSKDFNKYIGIYHLTSHTNVETKTYKEPLDTIETYVGTKLNLALDKISVQIGKPIHIDDLPEYGGD